MMKVIPKQRTRSNPRNPQVHRRGFEKEHLMKLKEGGRNKEITCRHDLLALRRGRTSIEKNLEKSKVFPQKVFKKKSPW
jgi:hypothetical protein